MSPDKASSAPAESVALLSKAQEVISKDPKLAEWNKTLNEAGLRNVDLRKEVVKRMLENNHLPKGMDDAKQLENELLKLLDEKEHALTAQQKVVEGAEKNKSFWKSAMAKMKNVFSAVGGHLKRNWGKYLILAAAAGAGWYFRADILAWIQKKMAVAGQRVLDKGAVAAAKAAPVMTPSVDSVGSSLVGGATQTGSPYVSSPEWAEKAVNWASGGLKDLGKTLSELQPPVPMEKMSIPESGDAAKFLFGSPKK